MTAAQLRKRRGDFPTPPTLVRILVEAIMPSVVAGRSVRVLDPACGDGRFLVAAAEHVVTGGGHPVLRGIDVDSRAAQEAARALRELAQRLGPLDWSVEHGDALAADAGPAGSPFDVVLGNPPYLSQLASATTRGRSSGRGGGPYADAAAEFLVMAIDRVKPGGGRVGLVLPQSILASRDVADLRAEVDRRADLIWSWWSGRKHFDADVFVCGLGFERRPEFSGGNSVAPKGDSASVWNEVIVRALGVPSLPPIAATGTAGDRALFTANFRDEYYGLVPAVDDHAAGPRLVTSGLIDPARCWWGERDVTFHRRSFGAPRVDVSALSERMRRWARSLSVPKVLIGNQTKIIECVVDPDGTTLPGVPVVTARPVHPHDDGLTAIAAVLSSPYASAWAWHRTAGTGLSARTMRVGPRVLNDLPWPSGPLEAAVGAWRRGDLVASARAVDAAYGIAGDDDLVAWWRALLP